MNTATILHVCTGPGIGPGHNNMERRRFPPWMVWGGLHEHHRGGHRERFVVPPFVRYAPPPRTVHSVATEFKICDCPIVCYFSMAIALILIGCLTTAFVLDDTFGQFSSMVSQLWLVGPLFISCGIVIFVRTVIFLRRKHLLKRQRNELRRLRRTLRRTQSQNQADQELAGCSRRDSFSSLPPDYEAVINGVYATSTVPCGHTAAAARRSSRAQRPSLAFLNLEEPPPAYDDIVLTISAAGICPPEYPGVPEPGILILPVNETQRTGVVAEKKSVSPDAKARTAENSVESWDVTS